MTGPLPAQVTSLETKPAYRASGADEPGEATTVYVVPKVDFDRNGPWLAIAMLKGENGLEASRVPQPGGRRVPADPAGRREGAGDPHPDRRRRRRRPGEDRHPRPARPDARRSTSPTCVGKKPIVLVFATPALCQSRVCGPVVDVAQQVADEYKGKADFIHMEVYNDNDISKGIRPQLRSLQPGNRALDLPDRQATESSATASRAPMACLNWKKRCGRSFLAEQPGFATSSTRRRVRGPALVHPLGGRVAVKRRCKERYEAQAGSPRPRPRALRGARRASPPRPSPARAVARRRSRRRRRPSKSASTAAGTGRSRRRSTPPAPSSSRSGTPRRRRSSRSRPGKYVEGVVARRHRAEEELRRPDDRGRRRRTARRRSSKARTPRANSAPRRTGSRRSASTASC